MSKNINKKSEVIMEKSDVIKSYPTGTIVLQYINDDIEMIGAVVGDHMYQRLSSDDKKTFNLKSPHHCLLVFGFNCRYQHKEPLQFRNPHYNTGMFPWYKVGKIELSTPTNLKHEIDSLAFYKKEPVSNGLNSGKLRGRFFGPTSRQTEIIEMAMLTQHYMVGGNFDNSPKTSLSESEVRAFYDELAIAIPRL